MQRVVVDATVAVAALLKDGATRRIMIRPPDGVQLCAPDSLFREAASKIPLAASRLGIALDVAETLLQDILALVRPIPEELLLDTWEATVEACAKAAANGDEAYVAAALALKAPIWTFDPDFDRVAAIEPRLRVWTTGQVLKAGDP